MVINLTQGNYGHIITINIKNKDGTAMPLSSATVSMDLVYPDKVKANYPLTVTDAANGKAQLTITNVMTAKIGKMKGYIDVNGASSKITLDNPLEFVVKADDGGVA